MFSLGAGSRHTWNIGESVSFLIARKRIADPDGFEPDPVRANPYPDTGGVQPDPVGAHPFPDTGGVEPDPVGADPDPGGVHHYSDPTLEKKTQDLDPSVKKQPRSNSIRINLDIITLVKKFRKKISIMA